MEPEIARRCLGCGASVRGRAHFCPQCGRPMEGAEVIPARAAAPPPQPQPRLPLAEEAERVAARISDRLQAPPARENQAEKAGGGHGAQSRSAAAMTDAGGQSSATDASVAVPDAPVAAPDVDVAAPGAAEGARDAGAERARREEGARGAGALRRASAVAGESLRPRVERLREASAGVLDEAADDPGLRFVVVAAVLFLVFLLLWLFSYALG